MLPFLREILQQFQDILTPIYLVSAWFFVLILAWTLIKAMTDLIKKTKQMHQIPCSNCNYFTNNYRLKCTVNPSLATTEEAVNCSDYKPKVI